MVATASQTRPGSDYRTTGAIPPPPKIQPAVSMNDAARRCRIIAADINAAECAVFLIGPSVERGRLVPCFDAEYPSIAATTKLLSIRSGEIIVKHALVSPAPFWWSSNTASASAAGFRQLAWAVETEPCLPGTSGLAFPVQAEHGQFGIVLFMGSSIIIDEPSLCDVHARSFALFGAVARLRSSEHRAAPSISKRELECLRLTANGHTSDDIARLLGLSVHTANQYLSNATQKLNAVNRMHAVAKALRLSLIE
ncbi:DNA-binding transcriptional regulator, CsgD family [Mesorhizobium albiziae]|uniref:DNA-binding transcriptional regulator, CsgD family n=1 Tax=Neomesorhizobium albiziae TaxID=335020 RepID=A0A1I4DKH1_9HYPH|nr:helix-turn-helix transcriptional regulator [Mesorhizobium albiziae]GLS31295.1 helix-turn-helix transcriptional regulator [Mesorhizobium albiziae]SFK94118.1 DNA-binding transcriptional regulator, CsgD family [Mesorhizobium albiziae]